MKKFIIFLGALVLFSACGAEPVNETNFVEFWETEEFSAYYGEDIVSGRYLLTTLYSVEFYLDEESVDLVPPGALSYEEHIVFTDGEWDFLDEIGLGEEDPGCSYEGNATVKISSYSISKTEAYADEAIFDELIEFSEPEFLWCVAP